MNVGGPCARGHFAFKFCARVAALALAVATLVVQPGWPQAQDAASDDVGRCRARADSLAAVAASMRTRADSLAQRRALSAASGDAAGERYWLMRSEALAETIRAVSAAYLAQRLICQRLGDVLPLRAEFPLPEAEESDPPSILREKAGYARDLMDRSDRWLEIVAAERRRITESRLAAEAERLLFSERVLDEESALNVGGGAGRATLGDNPESPGLLSALLADMPGRNELEQPEDVLRALESWLTSRREALSARAQELEAEAARREMEP